MGDTLQEDKENESNNTNENENNFMAKKKGVSLFIGGETQGSIISCYNIQNKIIIGFTNNAGDLQSSFKKFRFYNNNNNNN